LIHQAILESAKLSPFWLSLNVRDEQNIENTARREGKANGKLLGIATVFDVGSKLSPRKLKIEPTEPKIGLSESVLGNAQYLCFNCS
jgi:hypothetical protein